MYADRLPIAIRQLVTDICVVIWVYAWIRAGLWLHDTVLKLGVPGQKLASAGSGIADNLADASGKVGRVPLVGDQLTKPIEVVRPAEGVGHSHPEQRQLPIGIEVVGQRQHRDRPPQRRAQPQQPPDWLETAATVQVGQQQPHVVERLGAHVIGRVHDRQGEPAR